MPKYKVGDVLKRGIAQIKIYEVTSNLYAWDWNDDLTVMHWSTHKEIDENYTLSQPARWVPKIAEEYQFLTDCGQIIETIFNNSSRDHFRLSIGNVFKVGDTAGIEALKKRWQEGV